ncbi:MAG: guanitoxin biosynthesis MBL fold metallo-hydrolase GntH [Planctomycetota bacterium]
MLKTMGVAAATVTAGGLASAEAAEGRQAAPGEHNAYGAPPGSGISMPPYYLPTPSLKNRNNYFPQSEPLGPDEMRIIFMGSNPWPPRMTQASTCIMVELGGTKHLFFDFGPGCLRNIVANQVPVPEVNDIFITHLHIDHFGELPYLYQFAPFNGRWKPLRVIGPSGRTPALGTKAACEAIKKMGAWTSAGFGVGPMADGYEFEVTEFDYRDDGGVCYDKDGVKVTHWRRSHMVDGASAYRLDWNGLSFVWTGDGKPDQLTAKYAKGVDVLVTEMAVDLVNLWALKQGVAPAVGAFTIDNCHTPHYAVGYLANLVQPRLAMACHLSYDRELIGEHHDDRDHSKAFSTWSFETDRPLSLEALREAASKLPASIYRAKGVIYTNSAPQRRAVLQVVGRRVDISLEDEWGKRPPRTQIVTIGAAGAIDEEALRDKFEQCLSALARL